VSDQIRIDPVQGEMAHAECPLISRRRFLQGVAAAAAGVTAVGALPSGALFASSEGPVDDGAYGMLIDLTRCTGCNSCSLACKQANSMEQPQCIPTELDSSSLSYVGGYDVTLADGSDSTVFVKRNCMHCLHPACVSACTVGALRKTPEGPVVYDSSKCIGCRYCQYACPFGYPVYEWEGALGLISKCEMCTSRLQEGELPACVGACPNGAIRFGTRKFLLAQAKSLIASNPGRYINHIYGEHEAGGTSVLYLSPVEFTALGFPALGEIEVPHYAEAVMKKTPIVAVTVATLAAAVQFLTRKRAEHAEFVPAESSKPAAPAPRDGGQS
jgi:formate dehydrogenase iron-sulfur subunit